MPRIVRDMATAIGIDEIAVDRSYRMSLPPSFIGTCHLQGVNEATHGIADSLLSVLAVRAGDITRDILADRGQPGPNGFARTGAGASFRPASLTME
jgi:L-ornithine N5-oxygenase